MAQPAYYPPGHVEGYQRINAELGREFDLYARENDEWMTANIPDGAAVVLQTDDECFNLWAREVAIRNRNLDSPPRPIVLVHLRELRPQQSRIVRADAELLAS